MKRSVRAMQRAAVRRLLPFALLLISTGLVAGLAARPAAADPATLAGETLYGFTLAVVPGVCNDSGPSTFTYPLGGSAAGPVSGTYSGTITVTLASPTGPITDVQGTFEINGGAVAGELSLIAPAGEASCNDFLDEVVFPVVRVDALLGYTVTSPFGEQGEVLIGLAAVSEMSVFGLPLVEFWTGEFSPGLAFDWAGFFRPIDNTDADGNYVLNVVKSGQGVPVKFSLGGDEGLAIFAEGYPRSSQVACDSGADLNVTSETVTAGGSSLSYDASTDTYSYVWKTERAWAGTCRQLDVTLVDGTTHSAQFKFN